MSRVDLVLLLLGGITLTLSFGATLLQTHRYLPSETMLAVAFGVMIGPFGLDVLPSIDSGSSLSLMEHIARLTEGLAVVSIALRLPENYFRRRLRSMAVLLVPGMLLMWLLSSLVASWALALPLWMALMVGAIVTPTDPVLASTIVTGQTAERNIPVRLRHLLSGEAGANDGMAYFLVSLAIFGYGYSGEGGVFEWTSVVLLWEILGAAALGAVVGGLAGRLEAWLSARGALEEASVLTITVALSFAVLGLASLLGMTGLLAVFVAGLTYNWQSNPRDEVREQKVEEVFNRLFTYPVFVLFGMTIPWEGWIEVGWQGALLALGILLFRRLPMTIALRSAIPPLNRKEATLFVGWFGPVGVSALYFGARATQEIGAELPWVLTTLVVAGSILAHGATGSLLTLGYGQLEDEAEWW